MTDLVPNPQLPESQQDGQSDQQADGHPSRGRRPTRRGAAIAGESECLQALSRLPGLITLGLVTTSQANAIRGIYGTLLQQHRHSQSTGQDRALRDADLLNMLRTQPELIGMLEPLLTDEQVDLLMQQAQDGDDDGQA